MLDLKRVLASAPRKHERVEPNPLATPWGENLDPAQVLQEHPRPQFAREGVRVLNGLWEYAIVPHEDAANAWRSAAAPAQFDGEILVPFSPEAPLSGVKEQVAPEDLLWYRLRFDAPALAADERCLLHFDGVDFACACYLNGIRLGEHQGAYIPFEFDITDALQPESNELLLCVFDPSIAGTQLRGKQRLEPSDIWYTAQSGIWKTVWLETVPECRILRTQINADPETGELTVRALVNAGGGELVVELLDGEDAATERVSALPELADEGRVCTARLTLDQPQLWSPEHPRLYDLRLSYGQDVVRTYCAFRSVEVREDECGVARFHLNGEPLFIKGVLDQGYWPDGLLTAPSDEALVHDIQTMRNLGFNMLRKHIKIESDRWYYHADRLGMLVWQDMPTGGGAYDSWHTSYKPTLMRASWGKFADGPAHYGSLSAADPAYRDEWTQTCTDMVTRLRNHPSIVTWVLFNEAWGQFDAAKATELVRALDPSRPIDAVSGWYDQNCGDYLSVHNYFRPLEVYPDVAREKLISRSKSGEVARRAFVISEFGGLSHAVEDHSAFDLSYGYAAFEQPSAWQDAVRDQLRQAEALEAKGLAGYVFTQLSDVEEEVNGLLTYDRRVNKMELGE